MLAVPSDYLLDGSGRSKCMDMVDRWGRKRAWVDGGNVLGRNRGQQGAAGGSPWGMGAGGWVPEARRPPPLLPPTRCSASQFNVKRLQFVPTLFWVDTGGLQRLHGSMQA